MKKRRNFRKMRKDVLDLIRKTENNNMKRSLEACIKRAEFLHDIKKYSDALDVLESAFCFYHDYLYK